MMDRIINQTAPALSSVIGHTRTATSHLTPKDDWVEGLKRRLCLAGDPFLSPLGRPLVSKKGRADYVCTVKASSDEVEMALHNRYQRNLTSTRKYRVIEGEREWACGSWVHDPEDTEWQHHVYLFDNRDGTADLYAHKEISAEYDPYGHVTEPQTHGDPDGIARGTLEEAHLKYD